MAPIPRAYPGSPLVISANSWNRLARAAEIVEASGIRPDESAPAQVLIRNTDEENPIPAFGVAAVTGITIDPATNLPGFLARPTLDVAPFTAPTQTPAIAKNRIEPGGIGKAMIFGLSYGRVVVTSESHRYAAPSTEEAWGLESAPSGKIRIVWKEAGEGLKWALLLLGGGSLEEGEVGEGGGSVGVMLAAILGDSAEYATARYVYNFTQAVPTGAPGEWVEATNPITGVCYQVTEGIAGNLMHSGVRTDRLGGFAPVPLAPGTPVVLTQFGSSPWLISATQAIDGAC